MSATQGITSHPVGTPVLSPYLDDIIDRKVKGAALTCLQAFVHWFLTTCCCFYPAYNRLYNEKMVEAGSGQGGSVLASPRVRGESVIEAPQTIEPVIETATPVVSTKETEPVMETATPAVVALEEEELEEEPFITQLACGELHDYTKEVCVTVKKEGGEPQWEYLTLRCARVFLYETADSIPKAYVILHNQEDRIIVRDSRDKKYSYIIEEYDGVSKTIRHTYNVSLKRYDIFYADFAGRDGRDQEAWVTNSAETVPNNRLVANNLILNIVEPEWVARQKAKAERKQAKQPPVEIAPLEEESESEDEMQEESIVSTVPGGPDLLTTRGGPTVPVISSPVAPAPSVSTPSPEPEEPLFAPGGPVPRGANPELVPRITRLSLSRGHLIDATSSKSADISTYSDPNMLGDYDYLTWKGYKVLFYTFDDKFTDASVYLTENEKILVHDDRGPLEVNLAGRHFVIGDQLYENTYQPGDGTERQEKVWIAVIADEIGNPLVPIATIKPRVEDGVLNKTRTINGDMPYQETDYGEGHLHDYTQKGVGLTRRSFGYERGYPREPKNEKIAYHMILTDPETRESIRVYWPLVDYRGALHPSRSHNVIVRDVFGEPGKIKIIEEGAFYIPRGTVDTNKTHMRDGQKVYLWREH